MLNAPALTSLAHQLGRVAASFQVQTSDMGRPEVVRQAAEEAAQMFQDFARSRPSPGEAYAAARAFLRGQPVGKEGLYFLAGALNVSVMEANGRRPFSGALFPALLDSYRREAQAGSLWLPTWFGLLCSYFEFNPQGALEQEIRAWEQLRAVLKQTWPTMSSKAGTEVVPDWVKVLRSDVELLSDNAAYKYGLDYLRGEEAGVKRLSFDLGIPESSWFWHALVLSAVQRSTEQKDESFKESIPRLLSLVQTRPFYRDVALEAILNRYHRCADPARHQILRDYVVRKDVWRNPKLRAAGLATSWNRVDDAVWRMALQWVNEANLKDFFAVLAARRNSDEGRLEFWSQYLEQISWTRLVLCSQTRLLTHSNEAIRSLIAREEDSYATLSTNADVDALMMQLGDYVVVEFSRTANNAYVYRADELPFEPYAREYTGTTADLKAGLYGEPTARILHNADWSSDTAAKLRHLGIFPDDSGRTRRRADTATALA